MYCPECGSKTEDTDVYCCNCGYDLRLCEEESVTSQIEVTNEDTAIEQTESTDQTELIGQNESTDQTELIDQYETIDETELINQEESFDQTEFINQLSNKVAYHPEKIEQAPKQSQKEKPKSNVHKHHGLIIAIAILAVLIVASIGGFLYLKQETSPKKVAENFFLAVMNQDADTLYDQLDLVESDFINKIALASMVQQSPKIELNSYAITLQDTSNLGKTYQVEYKKKGSSETLTLIIRLINQSKKRYFLFDSYKVDSSDMIVENYMLKVPVGSQVKLDNIELTEELLDKKQVSEGYDTYIIPALLDKEYNLTVTKDGKKEVTETIQLNNNYQVTTMELSAKSASVLIKQASDDIKRLYKAALQRQPYGDIKERFTSDYDTIEQRATDYDTFVNRLSKENGAGIVSLSFRDISGEITSTEGTKVGVSIGYNAEIDYITISGSPEVKKTESKSGYYRNELTYVYVGDQWLLDKFEYNTYGFN